ncbi:unnamed protein product [Hymenolepis diminuta]|uniref:Uncharacterized protein n=1 Tax=Hymenolepis diminuta TaxID=6216 RepID=A0A564Z8L6_HYMDI|nr:unnamed protein product [Hymenolepis diminuta]
MQENSSNFIGIERTALKTSSDEFTILKRLCEPALWEQFLVLLHSRKVDSNSPYLEMEKVEEIGTKNAEVK